MEAYGYPMCASGRAAIAAASRWRSPGAVVKSSRRHVNRRPPSSKMQGADGGHCWAIGVGVWCGWLPRYLREESPDQAGRARICRRPV